MKTKILFFIISIFSLVTCNQETENEVNEINQKQSIKSSGLIQFHPIRVQFFAEKNAKGTPIHTISFGGGSYKYNDQQKQETVLLKKAKSIRIIDPNNVYYNTSGTFVYLLLINQKDRSNFYSGYKTFTGKYYKDYNIDDMFFTGSNYILRYSCLVGYRSPLPRK